jgi:hypothetical protein
MFHTAAQSSESFIIDKQTFHRCFRTCLIVFHIVSLKSEPQLKYHETWNRTSSEWVDFGEYQGVFSGKYCCTNDRFSQIDGISSSIDTIDF